MEEQEIPRNSVDKPQAADVAPSTGGLAPTVTSNCGVLLTVEYGWSDTLGSQSYTKATDN